MNETYLQLLNQIVTMYEIVEKLDNLLAKNILELALTEVAREATAIVDASRLWKGNAPCHMTI